jgi:two-component system, LytTR family, response regulator
VTPLRVLVADDEKLARARLVRLLGAIEGVVIAGERVSGAEVVTAVREGLADVLLLDVSMPGLSGVEAVRLLPEPRPYVIFCTAHAEHAVSAFDVGAIDYLLKPVEAGRLALAVERARRALSAERTSAPAPRASVVTATGPGVSRRLAIDTAQGVVLLDPADISHAELGEALVTVHAGGRAVLTDLSLAALEDRLPPGMFVRVHRRALLNLDHVALLEPAPSGGYVARTRDGHSVEVSRQAARELRRALGLG